MATRTRITAKRARRAATPAKPPKPGDRRERNRPSETPPITTARCTTPCSRRPRRCSNATGCGADAARGGARGRRVPCRADASFRRPHRSRQRTRRDRLSPIQRRDGGSRLSDPSAVDERHGAGQGLCRLCPGPSRHVRADVPHRASRHDAALAARGRQRLVRGLAGAIGASRHEQIAAEALSLDQAAAIVRAWSLVHGFTMLLLDGRLADMLRRLPRAPTPKLAGRDAAARRRSGRPGVSKRLVKQQRNRHGEPLAIWGRSTNDARKA